MVRETRGWRELPAGSAQKAKPVSGNRRWRTCEEDLIGRPMAPGVLAGTPPAMHWAWSRSGVQFVTVLANESRPISLQ